MTPANQVPMAPQQPSVFQAVAGSVFGTLMSGQGSARRWLLGAAGVLLVALNNRLGLGMSEEMQKYVLGSIVAMVVASNAKEAANVRSANNAQSAITVAYHQANAAIVAAQADDDDAPPPATAAAPPPVAAAPSPPPAVPTPVAAPPAVPPPAGGAS